MLQRAPSFDCELHQLNGLELAEVEVGHEYLFTETDEQLSVDVHTVKLVDVLVEMK